MAAGDAFGDLRKLADWFSTSPQRPSLHVERITKRLGATAVPLLGRELRNSDARRRDAARECLALVGSQSEAARERVIEELRRVLDDAIADELKVSTLGLLAELGEHVRATFADPRAMQVRSALALAAHLDDAADVASAADMMVRQLDGDDITQMMEVLAETEAVAAYRLATELAARLDLDLEVRERIAPLAGEAKQVAPKRMPRPTHVAVLVDVSARIVVIASRKISGERRWRRWAVLIGSAGTIEDCVHEEAQLDAAPLIASLVDDHYRVASTEVDHARTVVAAAARLSARTDDLTSAYYLGRDLLDLGNAHLPPRRDPLVLARAIDLIADGDYERAEQLLERCPDQTSADHAAAVAAIALARSRHADAIDPLTRAIAAEPAWPLHHWNLAVAFHALGDASGCYHALRRFVSTSARPTALAGDPDQTARVATAERMLAELERAARLAGRSLRRSRRKTAKRRSS